MSRSKVPGPIHPSQLPPSRRFPSSSHDAAKESTGVRIGKVTMMSFQPGSRAKATSSSRSKDDSPMTKSPSDKLSSPIVPNGAGDRTDRELEGVWAKGPPGEGEADQLSEKQANLAVVSPPKVQNIGSRDLHVSWDACKHRPCTYELEKAVDKATKWESCYKGDCLEHSLTKLTPGTSYSFRVHAFDGDVVGDFSPVSTVRTKVTVPDVPSAPRLSNRTRQSLTLRWAAPAENGSPITNYCLEWDEGKGTGDFVEVYRGGDRQHKLTEKLEPGQSYSFRLLAENDIGKSELSSVASFFTNAGVPSQPDSPTMVESTSSSLTIGWTAPNSNGANLTHFKLEMDDPTTQYGFVAVYNGELLRHTCEDLQPNTSYKFRVFASNSQGSSQASSISTMLTRSAPPGPPEHIRLIGKPHPYMFTAEWDAPSDDGGSEVTLYNVELSSETEEYHEVYSDSACQCKVEQLSPGQAYKVRVAAVSDAGGRGQWTKPFSVRLPPTLPGAPSNLASTGRPKASSLVLSWSAPTLNGGASINSYALEMAPEGKSEFSPVYMGADRSHQVQSLRPGATYQFRVRAANKVGNGPYSAVALATTGAGPPGPPVAPLATSATASSVSLSWQEPENFGAPVREYVLEQVTGDTFEKRYRGKNCTCDVSSLKPATEYHFRIMAINVAGPGPFSEISSASTLAAPPGAVAGLRVISTSSDSITISWQQPPSHGSPITAYQAEVIGQPLPPSVTSMQYTASNLKANHNYRLRVQAINKIGCGPFSSSVAAVTQTTRPPAPTIELAGRTHNSLRLRWSGRGHLSYSLEMKEAHEHRFQEVYSGSSTAHKIPRLKPSTLYYFRMCASNDAGSGEFCPTVTYSTTATPPPPPKGVAVKDVSETQAVVSWSWSGKLPESAMFEVQCQSETTSSDYNQVYVGEQRQFSLSDLRPASQHRIRVRCRCAAQNDMPELLGTFSEAVAFKTKGQPPKSASAGESSQVHSPSVEKETSRIQTASSVTTSPWSDEQWAFAILALFGILAIVAAIFAAVWIA